ncbi:hypothetical protein [Burkholderia pseudomallei]
MVEAPGAARPQAEQRARAAAEILAPTRPQTRALSLPLVACHAERPFWLREHVMPESTMPYSATLDCASAGGTAAPIPIPATARLSRFISNLLRRFVCRPRAFAPPATCFIN